MVSPTRKPMHDAGPFDFERAYMRTLPRTPITDAHRRLERLRYHLVAARVAAPIRFDGALVADATANANATDSVKRSG
ncbi:MAG: hypothetical protein GC159_01240 [Phycisphaera sp.]|nr:hypothetical protein [Phycisphaera sp.]